jgi:hypothetical protein
MKTDPEAPHSVRCAVLGGDRRTGRGVASLPPTDPMSGTAPPIEGLPPAMTPHVTPAATEAADLGLTPRAIKGVAELCGIARASAYNWANRDLLPDTPLRVAGRKVWFDRVIVPWAVAGGYWAAGEPPVFPPLDDPYLEADLRRLTPVGKKEGADWLGISERTVEQWGPRGKLLDPDWLISDRMPAWAWRTWEEIGVRNGYFPPGPSD